MSAYSFLEIHSAQFKIPEGGSSETAAHKINFNFGRKSTVKHVCCSQKPQCKPDLSVTVNINKAAKGVAVLFVV